MSLVSIIMPSYNSSSFIHYSIQSVLNQTYSNWELIIVDDVSSDNSNAIIERCLKEDFRIKLVKLKKNSGPAIARNKGIEEAKGKYISFLDSDDLWLPNKLEKQIDFMKENNVFLCYASYTIIDEESNEIGKFIIPKNKVNYQGLLKTCIIGNLTAIYDVEKIGKVYMEDVGHEDYTLWLKILKEINYAHGIEESLAQYRVRNHSISSNKIKAARWQWNIYRCIENLNIFTSIYYFLHYTYNGIIKYK